MRIDKQIQELLNQVYADMAKQGAPLGLADMRALYRGQYTAFSRSVDEEVTRATVPLETNGSSAELILYTPVNLANTNRFILYLHGGGFVLGDADAYDSQSRRLACECAATVGFVEYRLAPENRFPAAFEDGLAAARKLIEQMRSSPAAQARLALLGDSAGGNLAISIADRLGEVPELCFAGLLYPVADMRPYADGAPLSASDERYARGFYLELDEMRFYAESYLRKPEDACDPRVSPRLRNEWRDSLPPIAVWTAEHDLLRDQGRDFADHLAASGHTVIAHCFEGLIHNFAQFTRVSERAEAAFLSICATTREYFIRAGAESVGGRSTA